MVLASWFFMYSAMLKINYRLLDWTFSQIQAANLEKHTHLSNFLGALNPNTAQARDEYVDPENMDWDRRTDAMEAAIDKGETP